MSEPDREPAGLRRRSFGVRPAVVCVLAIAALLVRVGVGAARGEALLEAGNGLYFMDEIARNLVAGDGYTIGGVPSVFHQPGYILALAAGYAVAGAGWTGVLATNAVVGVAQVLLTVRVAARLDPRAAVPAGVVAAAHPVLVWHGLAVADTTLFSVTLLGWLDATLAAARDGGRRNTILAGLWLGAAVLTRPSILPLVPLGALAVLVGRSDWRAALRFVAGSAAVAFVLALPWLVRNHALTGEFPLVGTHGAESMWAANSPGAPEATWQDSTYDEVSWSKAGTEFDVYAFQSRLDPAESVRREAVFQEAATRWIRENTGTFAAMTVVRFGRIWDLRYHPTRRGARELPGRLARTLVHASSHAPVLAFALVGVVVLWRRRERRVEVALLVGVLLLYTASHAAGAGYTRVRLPVDPLLVALAGAGAAALWSRFRASRAASGELGGDRPVSPRSS